MKVADAATMVKDNNPGFSVLEIPAEKEFGPLEGSPRVVRLFFDANGIVVNVDRGEGCSPQ